MKHLNWTDENWATAIKIAAVLVAVPRWIGALLEADGVPLMLTPDTAPWWGLFSALASAGMALVEGVAFWYTLRAWRNNGGKPLLVLVALSMAAFGVVLTPYIMANVTGNPLREILQGDWLVAWSSCVSLSTILIVASVGYAQPRKQAPAAQPAGEPLVTLQAQPTETPDVLVQHVTPQAQPLAPLTDHFVRMVWLAKKSNAPFDDIKDEAHACLNGTSESLATWLATGKQSMAVLAELLDIANDDRGVFDATCRGLRKPQGTEIKRQARP